MKILNTIFCTAQALLIYVKSCLPLLHNYSEIDGIVLLIHVGKKIDWFLNGISHYDFDTNVMFFHYVQSFISLANLFFQLLFLCVCFVRSLRVIYSVFSISSLDERAMHAYVCFGKQ